MISEPILRIMPVFVVIGVGFLAGRALKVTEDKVNFLLSLALYVFVPSLLFISVVKVGIPDGAWTIATAVLMVVLITSSIAYAVARRLRIDNDSKKSFLLGAMFMNLGSMGSTIALLLWGESAFILAMIAYVVAQFLLYTIGIMIASSDGKSFLSLKSAKQIFFLPPLYSLLLGTIVISNQIVIPEQLINMIGLIGGAAVPALLVSLGMQLSLQTPKLAGMKLPLICSGIRVGVGTSVALGLVFILPSFSIAEQGVVIIVGVMPTMISTMPIASKYRCNCDLLSMTIAISFIMSAISLLFVAH